MALLVPLHPARQPHLGLQPLLLAHLVLLVMLVLLTNPTLVFQSQCSRRLLQSRPPSTEEASTQWKPMLSRVPLHNVYFVKYIFPRNRISSDLS